MTVLMLSAFESCLLFHFFCLHSSLVSARSFCYLLSSFCRHEINFSTIIKDYKKKINEWSCYNTSANWQLVALVVCDFTDMNQNLSLTRTHINRSIDTQRHSRARSQLPTFEKLLVLSYGILSTIARTMGLIKNWNIFDLWLRLASETRMQTHQCA